eukprot:m.253283 g.253283  ORF g.253283 m.253283 type:complete len:404 (+) comp40369_c0_seq35:49-1260(+)
MAEVTNEKSPKVKKRRKSRKRWHSESEDGKSEQPKPKRADGKVLQRANSQSSLVFQLGGDITDPLNLKTEEIPGVDDVEAKSKKMDHVVLDVPPLQTDPLHLRASTSKPKASKASKKEASGHRKRRKRPSVASTKEQTPAAKAQTKPPAAAVPFRYGNYNRYYGYRGSNRDLDDRLGCMKKEWFAGKVCLDIGCNIGHVTLCIGREFVPKSIVGLDIDSQLISVAKKNVKHYLKPLRCVVDGKEVEFPQSLVKSFGRLEEHPELSGSVQDCSFPANVQFQSGNWVLKTDEDLEKVTPQYDVILLLSTTKWIHLNWGDDGIQRAFKRVYKSLHPGGLFIMEPQPFTSYTKKRKVAPEVYQSIKFQPTQFTDYLLSEVGFNCCQKLPIPENASSGFKRPIYLYTK